MAVRAASRLLQIAKQSVTVLGGTMAAYAVYRSEKNPYTSYRDWPLARCAVEIQHGRQDFNSYIKDNDHKLLPQCHPSVVRANQIFQDAIRDIKSRGRKDLSRFEWEVQVMESEETRTYPGGKIILSSEDAQMDDHELAYIVCHELGHTIARHSSGIAGFTASLCPLSPILHLAEKKADKIASVLMAHIGYDPRACIGPLSKDPQESAFTHPHPKERAEALVSSGTMAKAMEIYKTSKDLRKPYLYEGLPQPYLELLQPSEGRLKSEV